MTEIKPVALQIERIIAKHRRHVQMNPGVGKEKQDYAIACLDDVADDLARSVVHSASAPELVAVLTKLADWNKRYPKGREWQYGTAARIERELDAICDEVAALLDRIEGEQK